MSMREVALRAGLRTAWLVGPRLPASLARAAWSRGARLALATRLSDPTHWRRNAEVVLGRAPTRAETIAATSSYLRYWLELVTLPGWSAADVDARVRIDDLAGLQADLAGPGCVVALPHLGNWDLAGTFACQHGLPVSSVAEHLPGTAFEEFLAARERLGFRIHGHRDAGLVDALVADAREHRLVCLVADRNLSRSGVPVVWASPDGGRTVRLPAGPALVAQRSGARLRVLTTHYEADTLVIAVSPGLDVAPGPEGVAAATQAVADVFSRAVAAHVVDWHVYQPFFGAAG